MSILNLFRAGSVWAVALLLVGASLPGLAAPPSSTKYFDVKVAEGSTIGAAIALVTFTNLETSGKANFVSAEFTLSGATIQSVQVPSGTATFNSTTGYVSITSMTPVAAGQSFVVKVYFSSIVCGSQGATVTVTGAAVYPGNNQNGLVFVESEPSTGATSSTATVDANCDGLLDCESSQADFEFGESGITGKRGDNKDISACVKVPYDLVDNRASIVQRSVEFKWDYAAQPGASFEYTVPWFAELVDTTTGMPKPTKLAWLVNGGYITPVNGRACLSNSLPTCVGTLTNTITDVQTTFDVTSSGSCTAPAASTVPFAVTIHQERMLVTGITGSTWTVVRGDGQTTKAAHATASNIGSNPLPLDAAGKQMQMCIKEEKFTSVGADYCSGESGPICSIIEVTTTVFDIGDGLMIR